MAVKKASDTVHLTLIIFNIQKTFEDYGCNVDL